MKRTRTWTQLNQVIEIFYSNLTPARTYKTSNESGTKYIAKKGTVYANTTHKHSPNIGLKLPNKAQVN